MVTSGELRIGNLVTIRGNHRLRVVHSVEPSGARLRFPCGASEFYRNGELMPILLDYEIIQSFGLEKFTKTATSFHMLQNVYFFDTGKELVYNTLLLKIIS